MRPLTSMLTAALLTAGLVSSTNAQDSSQSQQGQNPPPPAKSSMSIPGGDLIQIRGQMPQEVRLGDSFDYQIEVVNTSDNVVLHDVKISQDLPRGMTIEKSKISQQNSKASQKKQSEQKKKSEQKKSADQKQKQKKQQAANGKQSWTIKKIGPGESRTVMVTAAGDQEGPARLCVTVTSYTPSLCVATKFVKPDLEIVKEAPKKADLCDDLQFTYFIKNTGSGAVEQFELKDELADGLTTVTGDKSLSFTIDGGLEPGETRKFVANLRAHKAGEFSSRAVVVRPDGKKTRSATTTTKVQAAQLDIAMEGPETQYINQLTNYTVRVTNNGDAAATQATLAMHLPEAVRLVRVGEPQASDNAVSDTAGKQDGQKSAKAKSKDQKSEKQKKSEKQRKQSQKNAKDSRKQEHPTFTETVELGDLKPGETVAVKFATIGEDSGQLKYLAVAEFACGPKDRESAARSQAITQTEFIALPALALAVVDDKDPVAVGDELVYTVAVENEGDAPDSNIKVVAELADGLEFVEASGATKASNEGSKVTFKPVDNLKPDETVEWTVRAKVKDASEAMLSAKLTSKHRKRAATAEEPTRLFKSNADQKQTGKSSEQAGEQQASSDG